MSGLSLREVDCPVHLPGPCFSSPWDFEFAFGSEEKIHVLTLCWVISKPMFVKTWTVFQKNSLNLCKGVDFWKSSGHAKGDAWPYCSSFGTPVCVSVDLMAFSCTVELVHIILLLWTEIEISGKTMGPDVSWKIAVWRRKPSQKKKTGSGFHNYIWCIGCLLPAYTVEIACCLILVFSFKCEKAR